METFLTFFAVALVVIITSKALLRDSLSWGAFGAIAGASALVCVLASAAGRAIQTSDTEILNGQVVSKTTQNVNCEHSYQCMCVQSCSTSSNGSQNCTQVCQTCYDHSYDVDWDLHTTLGAIGIERIDRQGLQEPPRWTRAQPGEPVAMTHNFTNYIRAAKNSLFHKGTPVPTTLAIPNYPNQVYDYHYLDRALPVGVQGVDTAWWNLAIANSLRTLGSERQVNFVIVFAGTKDPSYATALEHAWLGGKKNDVILVMGTPSPPAIEWVRVISWTDKQDFKVKLRDDVMAVGSLVHGDQIMKALVENTAKLFARKEMKDFEYLKSEIELPGWYITLVLVLLVGGCTAAALFASGRVGRNPYAKNWRW